MNKQLISAFVLFFLIACQSANRTAKLPFDPFNYGANKRTESENGAVASAHPLASKVGVEIMKQGGNAVDAAIAVQLALAVVYPQAGNLGGGGFMVARLSDGQNITIDYREAAPGAAHRDMYIDSAGNPRTDKSQNGHLASGVPGTVAGLFESAAYGKLSFRKLIEPAIILAEKGFRISTREAAGLNRLQNDLRKYNTVQPVFIKDTPWQDGDILIQKDLANTLKRIRDKGAAGFYEGETAKLITAEMKRGGGIITEEDLKNYKAIKRQPHIFHYKEYQIIGMPMPSSGGLLVNQMMKMIEKRNIGAMGFQSPQSVQLMVEAERRAYADRAKFMGDADFYKVPVKELTTDKYLEERMKDYTSEKAGSSTITSPGALPGYESPETTHLSVLDKEGNAVAVTTTLNNSYGSRTVVGGAGFLLNDEMDDFSVKPGVPNMYGAIGGEANAIAAGKRMLSSMTPTVVLKNNQPFLVLGTPGGTTIPTSVFQTLVNIIEFNMSTTDAVDKPKFHHQWLPDEVYTELGFQPRTQDALEKMGYKLKPSTSIGRMEVIRVLSNGKIEAVADRRGDDSAEGL
ncbi:gamma-glutamyltransferase [Terrimonas sp. NA20]|uniref:Glutathione hydrolase proenzyme n=1 Tax=Terrimonas ginsenosidimutans TaxID=2908004 RepID=A0ABS9KYI3_9BACT|nr:gamma-glutamyltransferase [Terrimonas ginsenosidimutans]MCG2617297.1 gamma-glutamyltransferase [Terrimonas ginsenosidimutans]